MDIKSLVRNASKIHDVLEELSDGRLITKKGVTITIPSRFAERGLAQVGIETWIVGHYAISIDDKFYAVSNVNAMLRITPTSTSRVKHNGTEYFEFYFEPGATVMPSVNPVKNDILVYKIYDEIISKGRVPWYLTYRDLGKIFDTALKHAGANIGRNHEVTELIISMIARNEKDRVMYYRQLVKTEEDIKNNPIAFIPLRSVTYAATNTTNKLAGSYFGEGVVSALVTPADRSERIEVLLLK